MIGDNPSKVYRFFIQMFVKFLDFDQIAFDIEAHDAIGQTAVTVSAAFLLDSILVWVRFTQRRGEKQTKQVTSGNTEMTFGK